MTDEQKRAAERDLQIREIIQRWLLAASWVGTDNTARQTCCTTLELANDSVKIDALAGEIQAVYAEPQQAQQGGIPAGSGGAQ